MRAAAAGRRRRTPATAGRTLGRRSRACYGFRVPGSYALPPLVETAVRGRLLRRVLWTATLAVAALGAVLLAQAPGTARARAFAAAFVDSAVKGTDLHRESIAAGSAEEVERARAWMVPEYRLVGCRSIGFAPATPYLECTVRFGNGGLAQLDVKEEDGRMRVVSFAASAPPARP